jgi:GxxExxY protein
LEDIERLATIVIDCGFKVHQALGPGLLESVYEAILLNSLTQRGLAALRQTSVPIQFNGKTFDEGFRVVILVEQRLVIELKSIERLAPVHGKKVLTYLRLMDLPLRLLMNFGAGTFREGIKRIANDYYR